MHIEFLHESAAVEFGGFDADFQRFRDLLGGFPLAYERQDLLLARSKLRMVPLEGLEASTIACDAPGLT